MILKNKYKQGEIVCEKIRPSQKLIVERYADGIYYCKLNESPHRKALVYLERDLMADNATGIRKLIPSQVEWARAPYRNRTRILKQLKIN